MKYILLFFLLFSFTAYSQFGFHKGYFIDNHNLKTECLIKYDNPLSTPSVFEYKQSQVGEIKYLNLENAKLINIENIAKFVNATFEIDNHTSNIQNLERNREIITTKQNHFLKIITEGKYTLYFYDGSVERFFYSSDKNDIILLKYKQYYDNENPTDISENTTYKRQLWNDIVCGFPIAQEINDLKYNLSDLETYFIKVNECHSGQKSQIITKKYQGYFDIKAGIYYSIINVDFIADEFQFSKKTDFTITGQLEYVFAFNDYRWSVNIEPVYFTYKDQTKYNNVNFFTSYNDASVNTKINFFTLPLGISYSFYKRDNQKGFVNISQSIFNKISNEYYSTENPNTTINLKINSPTFSFGLGYNYHSFEILYNFYPNFNEKKDYNFNLTRSAIILRYSLFNNKKIN